MAIKVISLKEEENAESQHAAYLSEGDRLFDRHLDSQEPANLLNDALNQYSRALEEKPDSASALARMARVFLRQGNHTRAERYARKSLALEKADPRSRQEAWMSLGLVNHFKGNHREAIRGLSRAIRQDALRSGRVRLHLYRTLHEVANLPGKNFGDAVFILALGGYALLTGMLLLPFDREGVKWTQLFSVLPESLLAWFQEEYGDKEDALNRYLNLYQRYPGMESLMISIGDLYRERNELDKARYWFEKAISRHPGNPDAYYYQGRVLELKEEFGAMADNYLQLLKLKPNDPHVHCHLANAYYHGGMHKEALGEYESALNLGTEKHWQALVAQSMAAIQADTMQNMDAAISYYELARLLDPTDVESYLQLGLLYFQKEDYPNAKLIYGKAMEIAPKNPRLHSNLGYLCWMEGDVEAAITYYEEAIRLDANYEIPLNNLGVIYLDTLGQVRRAMELFQQAMDLNENYALAYYNMGRAHSLLNNRLEAATCFQTAQNLNRFSRELDNEELADRISNLFETGSLEA